MDIAIVWDEAAGRGDWAVGAGDLALDPGGLRSAVLVSLFTDRVAPSGYVAPAGSPSDRRGWWGDSYEPAPLGSLLWTLDRSQKDGSTALLNAAQDMCRSALEWLVIAGVVDTVETAARWAGPDTLELSVTLKPPSGPPQTFSFPWAWQGA